MRTPASGPAAEEAGWGSLLLDPGIADQLAPQVALLAHEAGEVRGVPENASKPSAARRWRVSGLATTWLIAALSRATTSGGSPAGPK